jgi:hypothetical protein
MSVRLMSAIFETEFRDLQDRDGNITKASTAKFICLALADHANDEGEGAYPSLETLAKKTNLSRNCVINATDALKFNGIILNAGESKYHTSNYTVNPSAFVRIEGSKLRLLVNPNDQVSNPGLPEVVIPVDPNHTLTIHKPDMLDVLLEQEQKAQPIRNACLMFETAMLGSTVSQWPWDSTSKWQKFAKWVATQEPSQFTAYADWRKKDGKYQAMSNNKIRQDPQMFMDTGWPTFLAHTSMYGENTSKAFPL